jgi:hypothetical protein
MAIEKAVSLPTEKLQQMGQMGKEKVNQQHNIEIETNKLSQLLQAVNHN